MSRTSKDVLHRCALGAATAMLALTAGAAGDVVVLDFSEESSFAADDRYSVETNHLHWWGDGYATQGVLFAWDRENSAPAPGSISVTAEEGFVLEGLSFELGGYGDVYSELSFEFYVDGQLQSVSEGLQFDGAETLLSIDLPRLSGSSFEIVLDNYLTPAYVGLDNVTFSITPAPGAMALLGLAGVCGRRRRRA